MAPALTHCGEGCLAAMQPASWSTPTADLACALQQGRHLITHEVTTLTSGRPGQSWHLLLGSRPKNVAKHKAGQKDHGGATSHPSTNPATAIGGLFTREGAIVDVLSRSMRPALEYRILSGPARSQGSPSSEDAVAALTDQLPHDGQADARGDRRGSIVLIVSCYSRRRGRN